MTDNDDDISSLPYRLGVGIVLMNSDKKVLVAKRIDNATEAWQMPQGGIDKDEAPQAALFREMEEEIGTTKAKLVSESRQWFNYDLPENLQPFIWEGKYRGQQQKWYLLEFTGSDDDINIATQNPEFSEWKWVDPVELPDLIVPFKQKLYERIVNEFFDHF